MNWLDGNRRMGCLPSWRLVLPGMVFCVCLASARGQSAAASATSQGPHAGAPDTGLARHDFFYAGEAQQERMFIVRGGLVALSLTFPGKGEISDAVLLPNGHILFAHQFAVTEIDLQGHVVWNHDAARGTEIHTLQPYGKDSVLFIQNGNPAKAIVMSKRTDAVEREFVVPVAHPEIVHPQIRRARLTAASTLLVAKMDMGKAVEYDLNGKELWTVDAPGIWDAEPLLNGNVLISGNTQKYVREVNRKGETVWEFTAAEASEYGLTNMQTATRLQNGNTLITQWMNEWNGAVDQANPPVQAIEVTPEKKVVWVLRSWAPPADFGPSTTIQVLEGQPEVKLPLPQSH